MLEESLLNDASPSDDLIVASSSQKVFVSHPGVTKTQFLNLVRVGYLPNVLRNSIEALEKSHSEPGKITNLWNELNTFVPANFQDLLALYHVTCTLSLLPTKSDLITLKLEVMHNVFRQSANDWDSNPVHIHVICKTLFESLRSNRNLMYFARIICPISKMAFYISVCLVWSSLFVLLGKPVNMHRVHEFQTMLDMLEEIDIKKQKSDTEMFYSLLEIIAFLVNIIVLHKSKEVYSERFKRFFESTKDQIDQLLNWIRNVKFAFNFRSTVDNEDSILIMELIDFDIIQPIEDFTVHQEEI